MRRKRPSGTLWQGSHEQAGGAVFHPGKQFLRRPILARAAGLALVLATAFFGISLARGQNGIQESLVTSANAQPINLFADDIVTWKEGDRLVFQLKGEVVITQGVTTLRCPQGVVWVDEANREKTGAYQIDIYSDGATNLTQGLQQQTGVGGLVRMATRGDLKIQAYKSKLAQRNLAQEPLYQRAVKALAAAPAVLAKKDAAPPPLPPLASTPLLPDPPRIAPPIDPNLKQTQGFVPVPGSGPTVVPIPGVPGPAPLPPPVQPPLPPSLSDPKGLNPPRGPFEKPQNFSVRPRSSVPIQFSSKPMPSGETAWIVTNGVILTVKDPGAKIGMLDIEADRLVFWTRGSAQDLLDNLRGPQGQTTQAIEFYLQGNVELRYQNKKETEIIRADEVYYDVARRVAVCLKADLEIRDPKLIYPVHVKADEVLQLNAKVYQANNAKIFSSLLPSDPGLTVEVKQVVVEEKEIASKGLFGLPVIDKKTGLPATVVQREFDGDSFIARLEGVPVFYFPWLRGNVEDPLGPLEAIAFGSSRPFGFQFQTTWDLFDLFGINKPAGQRWRLYADYLTRRGPALGTEYDFAGKDLFGFEGSKYQGLVKAYGIYDSGTDILGGDRGTAAWLPNGSTVPVVHPQWRGRFLARENVLDLPDGFTVQGQVSVLSDRNFLEQYYSQEFLNDLNQDTYLYVRQQNGQWDWNILAQQRLVRYWDTTVNWLPKAEGALIGQSLADLFTWNIKGSVGYGQLQPPTVPSFAYFGTDQRVNTGRFDIWSDLSLPFSLGAFRIVPYVVGDLAYYTQDLSGDDQGRIYGGGGVRASVPLSRLYPEVQSEIFNLDGIYHKMVFSTNFFWAESNVPYTQLPQLDRFNDDTSDQALRDIRPRQPTLNPGNAAFLTSSPLFDPQMYALRRLIDNRVDTLGDMEVVQLGLRQRLQTKRGFPGSEHIVDWMTLDLGATFFPQANRDNFGQNWGILEYDWVWNVGDRTALVSNGWFETIDGGPRVFNIGAVLNRPDRTNFYLGYRQIDPLLSRAVVANVSYALSAKYAITASTVYDFGVHNEHVSLGLTRMGTDLQMTLGFSWNSVLNSFGVQFEIVPNLLANRGHAPGFGMAGPIGGGLGR